MVATPILVDNFKAIQVAGAARRLRIVVCGDIIRDQCTHGLASRLSPEYPVPVVLTDNNDYCEHPGGAANVARQFKHLNAEVELIGVIDHSTANLLDNYNISRSYCVEHCAAMVPIKRRIYGRQDAYLLRLDTEKPGYGLSATDLTATLLELTNQLERCQRDFAPDIAILSDYAKGVVDGTTLTALNHAFADIPILVDPKNLPALAYGQNLIKADLAYQKRHSLAGIMNYVVTRGDRPPIGDANGVAFTCTTRRRCHARDANGAGDCYLAVIAYCLGHGLPLPVAADLAYSAGRAYVQADHNRPVMPHEILADLAPHLAKVQEPTALAAILRERHSGDTVVITNGCFDMIHAGHLDTLWQAKSCGDVLVVALNSDTSVRRLKGPDRPVFGCAERTEMIAALSCVDYVVVFDDMSPESLFTIIKPDVLVKGFDSVPPLPGANQVKTAIVLPPPADNRRRLHTSTIISRCQSLNAGDHQ